MIKTQTAIVTWTFSLWWLLIGINCANAGSVKIAVSDALAHQKCEAQIRGDDPEKTVYSATSKEVKIFINNFLNGRQNRDLVDAALTNAGIVFCSSEESRKFADFILRQLDTSQPTPRLIPMIVQYQSLNSIHQLLERLLSSENISNEFRANLIRLKLAVEKSNTKNR